MHDQVLLNHIKQRYIASNATTLLAFRHVQLSKLLFILHDFHQSLFYILHDELNSVTLLMQSYTIMSLVTMHAS